MADERGNPMKQLTPLKFENRKSTGTLFVHTAIIEDGIEKSLHVSYIKKTHKWMFEIYQGQNYIVGSKNRSYSRAFPLNEVPAKYEEIMNRMRDKLTSYIWR
jgi:hypothetical protein